MQGKIVLCESIQGAEDAGFLSGAVGVIFGNNYPKDLPGAYALPALEVTLWDLRLIHSYLTSNRYVCLYRHHNYELHLPILREK